MKKYKILQNITKYKKMEQDKTIFNKFIATYNKP